MSNILIALLFIAEAQLSEVGIDWKSVTESKLDGSAQSSDYLQVIYELPRMHRSHQLQDIIIKQYTNLPSPLRGARPTARRLRRDAFARFRALKHLYLILSRIQIQHP